MELLPETRVGLAEIVSMEDSDPEEVLEALGTAARLGTWMVGPSGPCPRRGALAL